MAKLISLTKHDGARIILNSDKIITVVDSNRPDLGLAEITYGQFDGNYLYVTETKEQVLILANA